MKRMTARYSPSIEKMTSEGAERDEKICGSALEKGSMRIELENQRRPQGNRNGHGIGEHHDEPLLLTRQGQIASATEAPIDACPPASYLSFIQSPRRPRIAHSSD